MITQQHIDMLKRLVMVRKNGQGGTILEELQSAYRNSFKFGLRREFIGQVRKDASLMRAMTEQDYIELYTAARGGMSSLAEMLAEYVEFQRWLGTMIGESI